MFIPFILLILASAAAGVLAYGTHPIWAQFNHGVDFIIWARRLQWPLIFVSLSLCLALLEMVVSGKRRAWWLIGLLPILALFSHRFITGPARTLRVVEDPPMVAADQATFLTDDDYVVGVHFADQTYAFPYSVIFNTPTIIHNDRDKRMILIWSADANCAMAFNVTRELRAADLEIVSSPANALLLYNSRLGQFINGITAQTMRGEIPSDFREPLPMRKLTWAKWRAENPDSQVMAPMDLTWRTSPNQPILPRYSMPRSRSDLMENRLICVVATTQPIAVPSEKLQQTPLNLSAGKSAVLLFRQSLDGVACAFDRRIEEDLACRFSSDIDPKNADVVWSDADTGTRWSMAGVAVDGPPETRGKKLTPFPIQDELYWSVMKFWYPDLRLVGNDELTAAVVVPSNTIQDNTASAKKRRRPQRKAIGQ